MANKGKYIQDENEIVYKVMPTHLLKLSPWKDGEVVNNQFANTVEKWKFNGKNYIANSIGTNKNIKEYAYLLSTLPNHTISITNNENMTELKLIKHKGKIYYILIVNEFLPRVQAYNLFGEFCQWCGIDQCKPIFCEDDNRYV